MKKIITITTCLLLAAFLLVGCAAPAPASQAPASEAPASDAPASEAPANDAPASVATGEPVTITWAVFETNNFTPELYQMIIDAFEKDNPDIKIEKMLMVGDSRPQFLKTMLAAGTFPDVTLEANTLADLEGVFADAPAEIVAKFDEGTLAKCFGKYTVVPGSKQERVQVFYNKDQFAEAGIEKTPTTWEEFLDVCEKLKAAGKVPLICGGSKDIWATGSPYWVGSTNQDIMKVYPNFNEDLKAGKVKWNNETMVKSLKAFQDMAKAGYFHKGSMSFDYGQAAAEFAKGSSAMMIDGSWAAAGFDDAGNTNIGAFKMISLDPDASKTYCTSNIYWGVSETSTNKEAAWRFVDYVLGGNPDVYEAFLKADGLSSTTKEPVEYERGPVMSEFLSNFEGMSVVPEITKVIGDGAIPSGLEDITLKSLQAIFTGADIETELNMWDAETQKLLAAQQ